MKEKKVPVWVSIVLLVLVLAAIQSYIKIAVNEGTVLRTAACAFYCLTLICAYLYCLAGYKKDSALLFKWYCLLYAAYQVFVITRLSGTANVGPVLCHVIPVWLLGAFFFATNLGRKKSFWLAGTNHLVALVAFICGCIDGQMTYPFCNLALALVFMIMVYAKYTDKANRGTI